MKILKVVGVDSRVRYKQGDVHMLLLLFEVTHKLEMCTCLHCDTVRYWTIQSLCRHHYYVHCVHCLHLTNNKATCVMTSQ